MEEGDLVITPGWTWHEHVHKGSGPMFDGCA
jgi:gentisate 1,2-dioxygenase